MIRSRAKWVEEGEKPTRYFCNLENRNYLNKTIKKLELDVNSMIYDQARILDEVKKCYENLYIEKDSELLDLDLEDIIQNYEVPKLDKCLSELLDKDITEKEIFVVLKKYEK